MSTCFVFTQQEPLIDRTVKFILIRLFFIKVAFCPCGQWHFIEFSLVSTPPPIPLFLAGVNEHDVSLSPWLLAVTLCYIIQFNLADGHFLAHHPTSPLPFIFPFSPALLCTPLVSHSCVPSLHIWPSICSSFTHLHWPAFCFKCQFHTPDAHYICHCLCSPRTGSLPVLLSPLGKKQAPKGVVSSYMSMSANKLLLCFSDGELYAGTSADFMGRDFAIFRTLGKHHPIRTEQHDSRWLNGKIRGTDPMNWNQSLNWMCYSDEFGDKYSVTSS